MVRAAEQAGYALHNRVRFATTAFFSSSTHSPPGSRGLVFQLALALPATPAGG